MAHEDHDDDYSDLLSAEERAELEAKRQERGPLKEPPALSMAAEGMQDILTALVKPFKPYLRYHEMGRSTATENHPGDFIKDARDFVFDPMTLTRFMVDVNHAIAPLPNLTTSQPLTQATGGVGPLGGGITDLSIAGVNVSPEEARRLLPLLRQIVREEIERYERDQYRRMRVSGGYSNGRNKQQR